MTQDEKDPAGSRDPEERSRPLAPPSREVLEGVVRRDPEALRQFFERYVDAVYGLAYRLVGETWAQDLTQDVFAKVHRAAHQLDPEKNPRYWLTAITYNACREFWRSANHKLGQRTISLQDRPQIGHELADAARNPEDELLRREAERHLREALLSLPEPLRISILLHDFEGLGHEEIAGIVGISHVAARKRHSRALAELARAMEKRWT